MIKLLETIFQHKPLTKKILLDSEVFAEMDAKQENHTIDRVLKIQTIDEDVLVTMLYERCDSTHSSCNNDCPIHDLLTRQSVLETAQKYGVLDFEQDCEFFKNGSKMLYFLKKHLSNNTVILSKTNILEIENL